MRSIVKFNFSIFQRIFGSTKPNQQNQQQNQQQQPDKPKQQQKPQQKQILQEFNLYERKKFVESQANFAKLKELFKGIPEDVGKAGIEEVLYWAEGVATPSDIVLLVQAFNRVMLANRCEIPTTYVFQEFKKKVISYAHLCPDLKTVVSFSQFGKLYNVEDEELWMKLEEKLVQKASHTVQIENVVEVLSAFSDMRKGEEIYALVEQIILYNNLVDSLPLQSVCRLLYSYYLTKKGTEKLINLLVDIMQKKLPSMGKESLALVAPLLPDLKVPTPATLFENVEKRAVNLLPSMSLIELCRVGRGFGYSYGSEKFWDKIEQNVAPYLQKITSPDEVEAIIDGILVQYRVSTKFVTKVQQLIQQRDYLDELSARSLSQLAKALYIFQINCKPLQVAIEGRLIEYLREIKDVDLDTLLEITKNYCVTRHGSRDIYKVLEAVISYKMPEIKENRQILESLVVVYENSDLCSPELLASLRQVN